jgi:hypothetical protein
MMIVLANMEQLAEAASEVSDLLEATQALVLLVTSRRLLDVRGERIYTLGPLAVPADEAVTAAVELFLERARSIHPEYQPTAIALRREDAASALRMGRALASYWYISGSYGEGRSWMEQVTGLPSAPPYERALAWMIGAIQAFMQGDFEAIDTRLDEARRLAAEGEDRRTVAFAQLLQAIARGAEFDDRQWQDAVSEASRRLEAEGEPLAVGFGLVAAALRANIHGRMDEARRLAQQAHDLSVQIGDSFIRAYASTQLARACLKLGDIMAARHSAVEALLVARRIPNVAAMGYALELWATAELRDGRAERAGQLYALAERGYRQAGYQLWRTDAEEHRQFDTELRAALGDRYEEVLAQSQTIDLDRAIDELVESDPAAQALRHRISLVAADR